MKRRKSEEVTVVDVCLIVRGIAWSGWGQRERREMRLLQRLRDALVEERTGGKEEKTGGERSKIYVLQMKPAAASFTMKI